MKTKISLEYVKWGLANRFDDSIELNESLKTNTKLHNAILDHELAHKDTNTFKQDLVHDLKPISHIDQKEVLVFMLKHPRTWTQLLPFYWSPKRKQLIYDLNMLIVYGFIISLVIFLIFLIR